MTMNLPVLHKHDPDLPMGMMATYTAHTDVDWVTSGAVEIRQRRAINPLFTILSDQPTQEVRTWRDDCVVLRLSDLKEIVRRIEAGQFLHSAVPDRIVLTHEMPESIIITIPDKIPFTEET